MSLNDDIKKRTRKVIQLPGVPRLILSPAIFSKIAIAHAEVKQNTEWSGVLIYDTVEGDYKDPENWVIKVEDFILMDIGSSAYTEYNFDSSDSYSFDTYSDAMVDGKRIGHIHTHHNMKCFFSGTDTGELHDNAPNHAYYLSLIVNYQHYDQWCAKVAIAGELETAGTKYTFSNTKEVMAHADTKLEALFVMDCVIELEGEEDLMQRVKQLSTPTPKHTTGFSWSAGSMFKEMSPVQGTLSLFEDDNDFFLPETKSSKRPDGIFSLNKVEEFLTLFLSTQGTLYLHLNQVVDNLDTAFQKLTKLDPAAFKWVVGQYHSFIEDAAADFFNLADLNEEDMFFIVEGMEMVCAQGGIPTAYGEVYDAVIDDLLMSYRSHLDISDPEEAFRLTGVRYNIENM